MVSLSTAYTDAAGNTGTAAQSVNYAVDTKAPTASITLNDSALKIGETATATITFSEAPTGFALEDLSAQSGQLSNLSAATTNQDGTVTYTATFTPAADIEDTTNVVSLSTAYTDAAGNTGTAATSANYTVDTKAPTATITLSDSALKSGETATVTVTFSEAPTGFALEDLSAQNGQLSNLSAATTNQDGTVTYTATFTPSTDIEDTTNVVSLSTGYTDTAGNTGTAATSANYTVDTKAPTVAINPISGGFVNDAEDESSLKISGTATGADGLLVKVYVGEVLTTPEVIDGAWSATLTSQQVKDSLTAGTVSVTADVSDAAGNAATQGTASFVYDNNAEFINSAAEFTDLVAGKFTFAEGVDVLVTGTAFLGGTGTPNQAAAVLFADADVTVELTGDAVSGDVGAIISGGDAYLDTLTANLIASGVDEIALSDAQVSALLAANVGLTPDLSFDAGVDVLVTGTAFLGGAGAPNQAAAAVLFADADVTVEVGSSALDEILVLGSEGARDGAFDNLVADLQAAGVDNLEFSADQIEALAAAGVNFDAGSPLGVIVQGTSFLSSGTNIATLFNPLDESTVTVRLSDLEINGFLANAPSFDSTLDALDAAGVDAVQIDVGQAMQLSDAGLDFDVQPGLDVVVQGTHFLEKGLSSGSELFSGGGLVSKLWPGGPNTPPLPPLPPLQAQADISSEFGPSAFAQVLMEEPAGADVAALEDALSMPDPFLAGDDVLAQVELLSDTIASAAYVDILSTDDLLQALQDVGLGSGAMTDNPLSDLMMVLAAAPMASNPLDAGVDRMAAGGGLLEGLSGGIVSDAGDLASLLDPAAQDSPHHDVGLPTAEDASALFNTLAAQQGGIQVQVLGGMETAAADPFDPFQQQKT